MRLKKGVKREDELERENDYVYSGELVQTTSSLEPEKTHTTRLECIQKTKVTY